MLYEKYVSRVASHLRQSLHSVRVIPCLAPFVVVIAVVSPAISIFHISLTNNGVIHNAFERVSIRIKKENGTTKGDERVLFY